MEMAYNPTMYQGYGNIYGNSYGQAYPQLGQSGYQQPAMTQGYAGQQANGIDWVDGESAARASQLPAGVNQHAMWDINEPVIYLKSLNQMGMPNPLRKLRYVVEDMPSSSGQSQAMLTSGDAENHQNMSQYVRRDEIQTDQFVRKDDMERMKQELMESIHGITANNANAGTRRNTKGE